MSFWFILVLMLNNKELHSCSHLFVFLCVVAEALNMICHCILNVLHVKKLINVFWSLYLVPNFFSLQLSSCLNVDIWHLPHSVSLRLKKLWMHRLCMFYLSTPNWCLTIQQYCCEIRLVIKKGMLISITTDSHILHFYKEALVVFPVDL